MLWTGPRKLYSLIEGVNKMLEWSCASHSITIINKSILRSQVFHTQLMASILSYSIVTITYACLPLFDSISKLYSVVYHRRLS